MSMLNSVSESAQTVKNSAAENTAELNKVMARQRRKSRELETQVFGMDLTDVDKLRKIFDSIDEDKSGSIDPEELGIALQKAGKNPTRELLKKLFEKYDTDGNGTLEFNEYQGMIKDWDAVVDEFTKEEQRMAAALAAAQPAPTGRRSRQNSKELPELPTDEGGARSRRTSRELLPNMESLDLSPGAGATWGGAEAKKALAEGRSALSDLTEEQRQGLMAHVSARGAGNRRRSI